MCVQVGSTEGGWGVRHGKDQLVTQMFLIFGNATS